MGIFLLIWYQVFLLTKYVFGIIKPGPDNYNPTKKSHSQRNLSPSLPHRGTNIYMQELEED